MWKKFKRWLIKKLGGYVNPPKELVVDTYEVYPSTVVAQKRIGIHCYKEACARDTTALTAIENQIGYLLGTELIKQGLVTYSICKNHLDETFTVSGIIQVIPPKERQGTDLVSVLRGETYDN